MSLLPLNPDQPGRRLPVDRIGDLFRFTGAVGPEAANARDDVIRAQVLLGQTGDLDLESLGGPTGWPGGELTRGLKRYQRRKGLTVDGLMLPDGETITALQDDLYDRLARYRTPTTAEVDRFHDRLARYRADGSDDVKRPRIELERLDGGTPPMRCGQVPIRRSHLACRVTSISISRRPSRPAHRSRRSHCPSILPPVLPESLTPRRAHTAYHRQRPRPDSSLRNGSTKRSTCWACHGRCIMGSPMVSRLRRHRRRLIPRLKPPVKPRR